MSKPSILVAGAGLGAALILWTDKHHHHHVPAAAPAPAPVHTVIIHSVTHTVTRVVGAHPLLTGGEIVIIVAVALIAGLVVALNLIARLA